MGLKEKIIVLDTETTNSLDDPFCYDVGFAVVDMLGNIYETHSYVVADIFLDEEMMASAYFIDKVPQYWEEIKEGKRELRRFSTVKSIFREVCRKYGIKKVAAYNCRFDYRSLNYTQRLLTSSKYRYFFPYGMEFMDILKLARGVLKNNDEYGEFCYDNDFLTKRGQRRYTAEIVYKFLFNGKFEEEHTGLADCLIEGEIMVQLLGENDELDWKLW